jgi:16S rRNA (adenine1518-N6/adenine1519-N6)-dimethyltransferase
MRPPVSITAGRRALPACRRMGLLLPDMKLSSIAATLAELGAKPTQSLGQNFLHDHNLARWIVDQVDIQPGEPWVEVGPGLGALTDFALERSTNGTLLEKDDRLIEWLKQRYPQLEVIHGDALEFDKRTLFPKGPVKVFGNLPYYVSSQLLFLFAEDPTPATRFVFTLQKELAERLCAEPRTKAYGALTLLLGRRWKAQLARILPAHLFTPVPKVDSAVVVLTPRPDDEIPECDGARFNRLVKAGFAQRRKLLRKNLALENWSEIAESMGILETARAEELSLNQWVTLTNLVSGSSGDHAAGAQDVNGEMFDVVDENNVVIGQKSRGEVHAEKLRHRAVHVFVFNKRGELFLQKRSRWKDKQPRKWDSSAAGHVNAGQDYDETAVREVEEELGVRADVELAGEIPACRNTGWEFVKIYRARHNGPFHLPPSEIECGGFFTIAQLARWIAARPEDFAKGFLECWHTLDAAQKLLP